MTLLTAGYFQTTYWAADYWNDDYWMDYGVPTVTGTGWYWNKTGWY